MTLQEIRRIPPWESIPGWPIEDWQAAVKEGDTCLGYKDWVIAMLEAHPTSSSYPEISNEPAH